MVEEHVARNEEEEADRMSEPITGAQSLVTSLEAAGVTDIFGRRLSPSRTRACPLSRR